ncbi:unnamed protein product [Amoebophrya sp. A120]|nr:unnamed protein product [Amoebophrya sp. A120]|eukprot:GSA120T00004238001.1
MFKVPIICKKFPRVLYRHDHYHTIRDLRRGIASLTSADEDHGPKRQLLRCTTLLAQLDTASEKAASPSRCLHVVRKWAQEVLAHLQHRTAEETFSAQDCVLSLFFLSQRFEILVPQGLCAGTYPPASGTKVRPRGSLLQQSSVLLHFRTTNSKSTRFNISRPASTSVPGPSWPIGYRNSNALAADIKSNFVLELPPTVWNVVSQTPLRSHLEAQELNLRQLALLCYSWARLRYAPDSTVWKLWTASTENAFLKPDCFESEDEKTLCRQHARCPTTQRKITGPHGGICGTRTSHVLVKMMLGLGGLLQMEAIAVRRATKFFSPRSARSLCGQALQAFGSTGVGRPTCATTPVDVAYVITASFLRDSLFPHIQALLPSLSRTELAMIVYNVKAFLPESFWEALSENIDLPLDDFLDSKEADGKHSSLFPPTFFDDLVYATLNEVERPEGDTDEKAHSSAGVFVSVAKLAVQGTTRIGSAALLQLVRSVSSRISAGEFRDLTLDARTGRKALKGRSCPQVISHCAQGAADIYLYCLDQKIKDSESTTSLEAHNIIFYDRARKL